MIAVMNIPKMEVAPASAAAAAEGFPEHMGALSVGIDHGYGKVEDVREQHAKELQRDKMNVEGTNGVEKRRGLALAAASRRHVLRRTIGCCNKLTHCG